MRLFRNDRSVEESEEWRISERNDARSCVAWGVRFGSVWFGLSDCSCTLNFEIDTGSVASGQFGVAAGQGRSCQ